MRPPLAVLIRRKLRGAGRRWREARMFARAMASPRHPIVVHLIPIRRCNLACGYCNEYDDFSPPVPIEALLRRVDLLASLGATIITLSGGEPLLHPELDALLRHIRRHGILATVITNGYLLTPERIRRLNRAGLDYLQISIDNVRPNDVSMKSLKVLDQKLQWLARYAEFAVTVNSVLGGGMPNPEDALTIARRARQLGFTATVGLLHAPGGQAQPLTAREREVYEQILELGKSLYSFAHYDRFQKNLVHGLPNRWHCRAGSRYLYVCEDGLVHWCSQQRGYPGVPLEEYTRAHLEREYHSAKSCAPYCTVSCVHQTAMVDWFRENPREALLQLVSSGGGRAPASVRLLAWLFLVSPQRRLFRTLALRLLGTRRHA